MPSLRAVRLHSSNMQPRQYAAKQWATHLCSGFISDPGRPHYKITRQASSYASSRHYHGLPGLSLRAGRTVDLDAGCCGRPIRDHTESNVYMRSCKSWRYQSSRTTSPECWSYHTWMQALHLPFSGRGRGQIGGGSSPQKPGGQVGWLAGPSWARPTRSDALSPSFCGDQHMIRTLHLPDRRRGCTQGGQSRPI